MPLIDNKRGGEEEGRGGMGLVAICISSLEPPPPPFQNEGWALSVVLIVKRREGEGELEGGRGLFYFVLAHKPPPSLPECREGPCYVR